MTDRIRKIQQLAKITAEINGVRKLCAAELVHIIQRPEEIIPSLQASRNMKSQLPDIKEPVSENEIVSFLVYFYSNNPHARVRNRHRTDWAELDWAKSNQELSRETGKHVETIRLNRIKYGSSKQ